MNVSQLGQVFTPAAIVKVMLSLRRNRGTVLEPSCGTGAFMAQLESTAVGIEIDKRVAAADRRICIGDFFDYAVTNQFDTIIGNPPYVRYQAIMPATKKLLPMDWFDRRSNLYLFFIAKCMQHLHKDGELILITPRDFLKSTNAKRLNQALYQHGAITDFIDLGDKKIFAQATPNCAIWRWQLGRRSRKTNTGELFCYQNGQLWFAHSPPKGARLGDYCEVKVGAVSGADAIFNHNQYGNVAMVCSKTRSTQEKRKMIYNKQCGYLEQFKKELLKRRIRKFDETNWWQWGRQYHDKAGERVYVNCKTRQSQPFFVSDTRAYDGSVLALFPKPGIISASKLAHALNNIDWSSLGFVCDGRLLFTQRSLENAPVPIV